MVRSIRSNPLALTVLCLLAEKPMHPYEMAQTLRQRAKQESIRLNFGSLYGVVKSLDRQELIRAVETERQGRRPQRTIYEITAAGRLVMQNWLEELIALPVKEYLQFEAGLSLIGGLDPDRAIELLRQRCTALEDRLAKIDDALGETTRMRVPRLFLIEAEYQRALIEAELAWIRRIVAEMESGELEGVDEWRRWHSGDRSAFDELIPTESPTDGPADGPDEGQESGR